MAIYQLKGEDGTALAKGSVKRYVCELLTEEQRGQKWVQSSPGQLGVPHQRHFSHLPTDSKGKDK